MTYKALGRSIANYAAPVWSTNASDTSLEKIQRTPNEALRIITGPHRMSSTKLLQVGYHLNLPSAQYLVHLECLSPHHHDGSSTDGNEGDTLH